MEIGGSAKGHSLVFFDFTVPEDIVSFWKALPVQPDILINNASVFNRMTLLEESLPVAKQQLDVNFWAPVEMMRQMALHSSEQGEKLVINMLDQAVTKTPKDSFSYAISKKALAEATRIAALQFAPALRVNGICPGPVLPPVGLEHLKMQKTLSTLPLGRPVALDDLCNTALFLALNRSMTGSFIYVDCGQNLL